MLPYSIKVHGKRYYTAREAVCQGGRRGKTGIFYTFFCVLHVTRTEISKLESFGRACAYAACTGEGTSLCRTGLQANQLPGGSLGYMVSCTARACFRICLSVPVKHSFRECAVANRSARSRYSVLYVLIYKGDRLLADVDRTI